MSKVTPRSPKTDSARAGRARRGRTANGAKPGRADQLKDGAAEGGAQVVGWLDERTGMSPFLRGFLYRKVPKGTNWFYTLGSATMFAFVSQAVTGVFLAMYYNPDPSRAYESAAHLTNDVFLGELVRGMHRWGATVMIVLLFLHMGRTFVFGAYKYPRELNWIIGVILLVLTLAMGLTGYLLPFDQRSFWATVVGVNINASAPDHGPVPGGLHARRRRVHVDLAQPLLRDAHDADPGPDRRPDRRSPLPGGQAGHHRPALAQGGEEGPHA